MNIYHTYKNYTQNKVHSFCILGFVYLGTLLDDIVRKMGLMVLACFFVWVETI